MKFETHKAKNWITLTVAASSIGIALFSVAAPKKRKRAEVKDYTAEITAALPGKTTVEPEKARKVLIFAVTAGFRHKSIPTGKNALELLGSHTGAYEAVVSDDLANFEKEKLQEFDAVLFLNTTQNVFAPSKRAARKMPASDLALAKEKELRLKANFLEFVKSGKGFIGIHGATDTFHNWPEYGEMIGGYFDGHPWGAKTDVSIQVEPGKEKHPLIASWEGESLNIKEEVYQHKEPYDSSKYDMLLRLDTENSNMNVKGIKRKDNDFGIAWTKTCGEGRVFYSSIGHNDAVFYNPKVLQHYLAGIQYALGDLKVPTN